jgi:hypothetical protein
VDVEQDPDRVTEQLVKAFDVDPSEVLRVSAKTGLGLTTVLQALVERIPAPTACTKHKPQVTLGWAACVAPTGNTDDERQNSLSLRLTTARVM